MNKSTPKRRSYASAAREGAAEETKARILQAAKFLFGRKGIDKVTIADISERAGVATSTVYAIYKSKDGILRSLMQDALFGRPFRDALQLLAGVNDPVELVRLTAHVARAIYENESSDLGLLRRASGFSPALHKMEQEFEQIRYQQQQQRLRLLFESGKVKSGLSFEDARRIMWMYTSRDVYRMLVQEAGWPPQKYQEWLALALEEALTGNGKAKMEKPG